LAVALLAALATGCVERKMFIRSDPPGANVLLDGQPVGETPVEVPFTYYGTRELVFRKKGFDERRILETVDEPVYQLFPLDFVCEILVPAKITDRHEVAVTLTPTPTDESGQPDVDRAIERARALRERIRTKP
jgi:PEGA domain-containing protein